MKITDGKKVNAKNNIVLKGNIKKVIMVLAIYSLVTGTLSDMIQTMLDYRNFSGYMLLVFGARLAQVIILWKLSDHTELLAIPILAESLPYIYFRMLPWFVGGVYSTMFPPLRVILCVCFPIILFAAITIYTYKPIKPKARKIINVVCILCALYSIVDIIISFLGIYDGITLVTVVMMYPLWILAVKCFVVALAFVRADYVEAIQYDISKVGTSVNIYYAIVVFVGAIMMFYGFFIIAAGSEIHSYIDIYGNTQVYASDRVAPYVYSYGFMIAINYVIKRYLTSKKQG